MSYGFRVVSDRQTLLVDEEFPVFVCPRYTVSQEPTRAFRVRRLTTRDLWEFEAIINITFWETITTAAQPQLFIGQNYPDFTLRVVEVYYWNDPIRVYGSNAEASAYYVSHNDRDSWPANVSYEVQGSPGNWTGIRVRVSPRYYIYGSSHSASPQAVAEATPDFRHVFVPGCAGGEDQGDVGIRVTGPDGNTVFNSNCNTLTVTALSSTWQYSNRSFQDPLYHEFWRSACAPTSSQDLCLVVPRRRVRRYNNEIATVGALSYKGAPWRLVIGGRSGSPSHDPIVWVRPFHSRVYRAE